MARKKMVLTKKVMVSTSLRLNRFDRDRVIEAATRLGISVSEFHRCAIRKETDRVLNELKLSA